MGTKNNFLRGLAAGAPIGMGYLSVSFTFGIIAVASGLKWWQAVLISMTTLTSAGQLAGIGIMASPANYIEMLISQLTINVRYSFMSVSLSQKTDSKFKGIYRFILGFFMTDEIFAVASREKQVSRIFFLGLSVLPYAGWSLGTLMGALLGNILPEIIMNSLCIAIYGMFVAIIAPVARFERSVVFAVLIALVFSFSFEYLPILSEVSGGIAISICAVLAAAFAACLFPVKEEKA